MCTLGLLLLAVQRISWLSDTLISVNQNATIHDSALHDLGGLSAGSDDSLMLAACDLPQPQLPAPTSIQLQPQLPSPHQAGDQNEPWGFESLNSSLLQLPATGKLADCLLNLPPVNSNFKLPHWFSTFLLTFFIFLTQKSNSCQSSGLR